MTRQIHYTRYTVYELYTEYGEDFTGYYVYLASNRVVRITRAGRFDNLYRVYLDNNTSVVLSRDKQLDVGI